MNGEEWIPLFYVSEGKPVCRICGFKIERVFESAIKHIKNEQKKGRENDHFDVSYIITNNVVRVKRSDFTSTSEK